jgi:hypothetical protein
MSRFKPAGIAGNCVGLVIVVAGMLGFSASAFAETVAFKYTGKEQEFVVPAGVMTVHVAAIGGAGGKTPAVSPWRSALRRGRR